MRWVSERTTMTEGQVYTVTIGAALALVLAIVSVPAGSGSSSQLTPAAGPVAPLVTPAPSQDVQDAIDIGDPVVVPLNPAPTPPTRSASATPAPRATPAPVPTRAPTQEQLAYGEARNVVGFKLEPSGIAVATTGEIVVSVSDDDKGFVVTLEPDGDLVRQIPVAGSGRLAGLDIDDEGRTWVLAGSSVMRIDGSRPKHIFEVPDVPPCATALQGEACEQGPVDDPPDPRTIHVSSDGAVYVADSSQSTIWVFREGSNPRPYHQSVEYLEGPWGLAANDFDSMTFSVPSSLEASDPGSAAVYRLNPAGDGSAGTRALLATMPDSDGPADVAIAGSEAFVALSGGDAIARIASDGEVDRIEHDLLLGPKGVASNEELLLVVNGEQEDGVWKLVKVGIARIG